MANASSLRWMASHLGLATANLSNDVNSTSRILMEAEQEDGAENIQLGQFSERSLDFQQAGRIQEMWRTCKAIFAH